MREIDSTNWLIISPPAIGRLEVRCFVSIFDDNSCGLSRYNRGTQYLMSTPCDSRPSVSDDCADIEVVDEISDIIDILLTTLGDAGTGFGNCLLHYIVIFYEIRHDCKVVFGEGYRYDLPLDSILRTHFK